MWRAALGRKAALLLLVVGVAGGVSHLRAGPEPPDGYERHERERGARVTAWLGPGAARNVARHLRALHGFTVADDEVRLADTTRAPPGYGQPVVAWFSAAPRGEVLADLYSMRLRMSAFGIPLATAEPYNVTATPEGDERLLDVSGDRVLYATRIGGRYQNAVVLDFGGSWLPERAGFAARLVASVSARQLFGTWDGPARADVVLERPPAVLHGKLLSGSRVKLVYSADDSVTVDVLGGSVEPEGVARLLRGAPPQLEVMGLAADALRRSPLVGQDRVAAVEGVLFALTDWFRRQGHRVFPTAADRAPVMADLQPPKATEDWPPADISIRQGLPLEGRWRPFAPLDGDEPPVLRTFVRVDPERPYERTELFAFDMRRLALHFVGGTTHPRSTTGARGSGRIPDEHRGQLVAAFNGAFKVEHGRYGAVEGGTILVPPQAGLATVAIDREGRAAFGEWDIPRFAEPWRDLRQNLRPLVAAGEVNPRRLRHWGEVVAKLDESRTPRSAVGLTESGVMVYGWAPATSARLLGEAMRLAGVRFAMHLDMNPGHTGAEFYARGEDGAFEPVPGVEAMDHRRGRWLEVEARDFFYVTRSGGVPDGLPLEDAVGSEGRWKPVRTDQALPRVGRTWLRRERTKSNAQVRLVFADGERVSARVVPGLAEPRPRSGVQQADTWLRAAPVAWMETGLRAPLSRFGLVVDHRTWRLPRSGEMSLAVGPDGAVRVGRLGRRLPEGIDYAQLLQGPALLEDGKLGAGAAGGDGLPAAGAAQTPEGDLVLATAPDGDRRGLALGLRAAGARDALLLGESGTITTGVVRFFRAHGEALLGTDGVTDLFRPTELSQGAGTALVLVPRTPPPGARIVDTFQLEERPVR